MLFPRLMFDIEILMHLFNNKMILLKRHSHFSPKLIRVLISELTQR